MTNRKDCTQNDVVIDGIKISTWYSDGVDKPYMAVNMTKAVEVLEGYGLTDEEKTQLPALTAGYCRLLDEYQLTGYGDTELEAIQEAL